MQTGFPKDAYFRLGLVQSGTKKLNWLEQKIAPEWLLQIQKIKGTEHGVEAVQFYSLVEGTEHLKWEKKTSGFGYLHESVVAAWPQDSDSFEFVYSFKKPQGPIMALWLSSDGDDTKSTYEIRIKSIELLMEP